MKTNKQNKVQTIISNLIGELKTLSQYGPNYSRDAKRWLICNANLDASPFSSYEIVQGFAILRSRKSRSQTYARMEKTNKRLAKYLS